ncbi:sulfatase-like hydrolase/transferase [Mycoplasmatota bacterium]|nr:sulfatase-like hydrolase/transferase [Mycoplasmatota bacterium]
MKEYLKQKFILIGLFVAFYFVIEIIAFLWIDFRFLPKSFIIDLVFILFISSFILIIPSKKWGMIYMSTWLLFVNALFVTNANTFSGYFELFTFEQFKLLGEATDILNLDYISIRAFVDFLLITIVYIFSLKYINKKFLSGETIVNKKIYLHSLFLFLIVILSLTTTLSTKSLDPFGEYSEDVTLPALKRDALERYGFLAYYYKEVDLLYFKDEPFPQYDIPHKDSDQSEYFGLLEGYNIFTIMIESGESYAVHPLLTPNLYRMTNKGFDFINHYSENKTNVSEIIGMIGHYPPHSFDTTNYQYVFEDSLPSILSDTYETAYFHDNYSIFYSRGDILKMLGFENLYFHGEIFPETPRWEWDGNLTLDSDTASAMTDIMFQTDDPFYYFWTSLLTHGPYNEGQDNIQKFEDLGYYNLIEIAEGRGDWENPLKEYSQEDQERMLYYQAAMMDFDRGLGILIDALKEEGRYDDTIFVLYGDHAAYYHNFNRKIHSIEGEDAQFYDMDIYSSFYSIYNQRLSDAYLENHASTTMTKFVSPYTIVPTLMDLLGITYNQNLMLGNSIFADMEHVFYSNKTTTFFTDTLYSVNGYDIVYQKEYVGDHYLEEFRYQTDIMIDRLQMINEYYLNTRIEIEN